MFLKLPFAVSFSVLYIYVIYIYIYMFYSIYDTYILCNTYKMMMHGRINKLISFHFSLNWIFYHPNL